MQPLGDSGEIEVGYGLIKNIGNKGSVLKLRADGSNTGLNTVN